MADRFIDYETKVCADWLNMVDWAVVEALGSPTTPTEARQFIDAVEEAPNDGSAYVRKNLGWLVASAAMLHNELGGRDSADAHPQSAITGLDTRLTGIEADITTAQGDIVNLTAAVGDNSSRLTGAEADIVTLQGEMVTAQGDILTNAGAITTLAGRVTTNEGDIADLGTNKADITYVDATAATMLGMIIALG